MTTPDQPTDPYREQPGAGRTGDGSQPAWGQPGQQPSGEQQPYPGQDPYGAQQPSGQQPYGQDAYGAQQPYGQGARSPSGYPGSPYPGAAYPATPYGTAPYMPVYGYPKNGLGVWALSLGIVAFFCFGPLAGIAAIITGVLGRKAAQRGEANNGGLALAGIILGSAASVVWVLLVLLAVIPALVDPTSYSYGY